MEKVKFIFEVDGIRVEKEMNYPKIPTRKKIEEDMKEWFFDNQPMWFSYEVGEKKTNLDD